jgi:hypothetical protein
VKSFRQIDQQLWRGGGQAGAQLGVCANQIQTFIYRASFCSLGVSNITSIFT